MQQSVNIFIMIALVALACGKLQGVTKEQLREMKEQIRDELTKSPDQYQDVDFSKVPALINEAHQAVLDEPGTHGKLVLEDREIALKKELANAIFENLTRLANPIIKRVDRITDDIRTANWSKKTLAPVTLDNNKIEYEIANEINPRLYSVSDQLSLLDYDILAKADESIRSKAFEAAQKIINHVDELFTRLTIFIQSFNETSKKNKEKKPANNFTKDHFDETAQAILIMKYIIDELYTKLESIFTLINDITPIFTDITVKKLRHDASELKRKLYTIYEVKQSLFSTISIKTYNWIFRDLYYGYPQKDPLVEIPPSITQIRSERLGRPPTLIEKLGTPVVAILAAIIAGKMAKEVAEGIPIKEAVRSSIKAALAVATGWAAIKVGGAIKKAATEPEKLSSYEEPD